MQKISWNKSKCIGLPKHWPQKLHLWSWRPSWTDWMCCFKLAAVVNASSQNLHLWSLRPSWKVWICLFKLFGCLNASPQNLHLWSLRPLWTVWKCLFKSQDLANGFPQELHLWRFGFAATFERELFEVIDAAEADSSFSLYFFGWNFLSCWPAHSLITGYFIQSLNTAAQNFHIYVTFNAEFNALVQISNFLCANIIKIWKNWITW